MSDAVGKTLLGMDPRLKMLCAVSLGVLAWSAGVGGVLVQIAALAWLCWTLRAVLPEQRAVLRSYGWFLLMWTLAHFGVALWDGRPVGPSIMDSAVLALRLTSLLLSGLVLALSTSPRMLGLSLTWFLRPVLGRKAWKAALALALMVHFLPITWQTLARVRSTIAMRLPGASFWKRQMLTVQAMLRAMGQKTWNQALAVACRGLDVPDAWTPAFSVVLGDVLLVLGFVGVLGAASLL